VLPYSSTNEAWDRAEQLLASGRVFEGIVSSYNTRGLIVRFGKLQGFVPIEEISSQTSSKSPSAGQMQSAEGSWMSSLVDAKLQLTVIEADRRARRLVFSERRALR
jgi:small subunit ribosomal protein S1